MKRVFFICALASQVILAGCSTYDHSVVGTKKLLTDDQLSRIDLAVLIWAETDKDRAGEKRFFLSKKENNERGTKQVLRVRAALDHFDDKYVFGKDPKTNFDAKYKRDDIQSVLIQASNERCLEWQNYAFSQKARTNFWLHTGSLISTAAASIVTSELETKTWSAAAGAFSGIGTNYDKQFLENASAQVVLQGIQLAKEDRLKRISDLRKKDIAEYTLSEAVSDALDYHAACSINAGLVEVSKHLPKTTK